jgi:Membrane bound beta barrel domain (DUF5777)
MVMKKLIKIKLPLLQYSYTVLVLLLCMITGNLLAQDTAAVKKAEPVKYTFESHLLIDNQTVMVPLKGTFVFELQHRFGTINNGADDLWGIFAPSNIRLGVGYSPMDRLYVAVGMTKTEMEADFDLKYAIFRQTAGKMPVSMTYYVNMAIDTRDGSYFEYDVDRFTYFHQLLIARKITSKFSLQVAPSYSWFNNVEAYIDSMGQEQPKMENGHFAIAFSGVYKFNKKFAIIANYDQPITEHLTNNPHPNISAGVEFSTGSHAFQVFFGNYDYILQQNNNMLNQNDWTQSRYVIGFNITRLWD